MGLHAAVATTILPTSMPDMARTFYGEVLGLTFRGLDADGKLLFALAGGSTLALIEKPAGSQADHTAISFEVGDIGETIHELQARGVVFDDYDLPGLKMVDHVCVLGAEKAAWFKDPDGNILCLHEPLNR
ncbi:VOC family protein [Kineosporia sp. R_H_3]|uniref:VOC family protein n=1 Tax=Kineosporia sp. R_H_3 TaxID=1961848 RepID=UPI000B4A8E0F|nr:VOC family protein [Kineosporia sp. R_H_3]